MSKRLTSKQIMNHLELKLNSISAIHERWTALLNNPDFVNENLPKDLSILTVQKLFLSNIINELKTLNDET